ncbi:ABC transporter permease [Mycolicibacterium vaccae]|jgi:peptide/nickel transport system permease protein|uniref:ABC transporter n=1 Tax=Mycolicibacterium vaccae ATCC 25954 TaxID=1194972 RepID=K0UVK0_MYCVA|nr:ABC transporter permease [Mycolicibacterium vaccae]ANI40001.1 peptide ABC transporter permease [Mycolicibacterium vaccae 95051]EJZ09040.1 ABC transporter [Mycolicibacterium vaccae ATCC 25954]MCV7063358.1 ABC transporter permease [Mycolicibacterium vaccae]
MTVLDVLAVEAEEPAEPDLRIRVRTRGQRWRGPLLTALHRPGLLLSVLFLVLVFGWALFPELFTGRDPLIGVPRDKLQPPGAEYLFGTDHLGRDVFSRVVHGTALSLQATAIAVAVGLVVGSAIGVLSGFAGGRVDDVIMRLVDVLLSIPGLLLSLAVVTALGFGTVNVAVAVGVASVASFARLMRSDVLRTRTQTFIEAAEVCGVRKPTILWRHILPHSLGSVLVLAALEFGAAILAVSSLSFLGFGAPPPAPEWGSLVAEGRNYLATAWWLTTLPGLIIALAVLSANRISRALDNDGLIR